MQQMPHLLTASDLARTRRAAYNSLSCDIGQGEACNSTVAELQVAMLRAALNLSLFSVDALSQLLLSAEAWGVTLESNCADGVRLVFPEPVFCLDGSAPTAAHFHPTLDGDAMVLNATALAGPRQMIGGSRVNVLELGAEFLPSSGGKRLTLSVEEETLVAPLRGLMPRITLSTPLADCGDAPSMVPISALPAGPGCPWLGGMMASAVMAALTLFDLSRRLLPEEVFVCRWRRGFSRRIRHNVWPEPAPTISLPRETLPPSSPTPSPPSSPHGNRTRTIVKLEDDTCLVRRRIDRASFASIEAMSAASEAALSKKPNKLDRGVWLVSLGASSFLFAYWGAARYPYYTVVPLLPVWLAEVFLLSAQCSKRQTGRALLPALRTLSVWVMSIAVALVTAIPSATDLSPLRRLVIVGPTALVAALFIATDAASSRRTVKEQPASKSVALLRKLGTEALGSLALLIAVLTTVVGVPPYGAGDGIFPCHPTAVTVSATLTALLAPLSLGLLRRVRYPDADIHQSVEKKVLYEASDRLSKKSMVFWLIRTLRLSRRSNTAVVEELHDRRSWSSHSDAVSNESIISGQKLPGTVGQYKVGAATEALRDEHVSRGLFRTILFSLPSNAQSEFLLR